MKIISRSIPFLSLLAIIACQSNNSSPKDNTIKPDSQTVVVENKPVAPLASDTFAVSARLIYEDSSLSSFDVLNDKTKALWNVIIGAGDAEMPSEKTRLLIKGAADSISVLVKRGKHILVNKKNLTIYDSLVFVLNNTGCEEVMVDVTRGKKNLYKGTIEFHCGE